MNTTMTTTDNGAREMTDRTDFAEQMYQSTFSPRFDIWEGDDELILYGDLPGVDPENLSIEFENRQLSIHGKVCRHQEGENSLYAEYEIGDFHRTFTVGEVIDSNGITAELHDGVLTLRLPKAEGARPRRISVKSD